MYNNNLVPDDFDDDELDSNSKLFSVSEDTEKPIRDYFTKGPTHKQWRDRYSAFRQRSLRWTRWLRTN